MQAWAVEHANSLLEKHRLPFIYLYFLRWSKALFPRKMEVITEAIKKLKRFEVLVFVYLTSYAFQLKHN